MEPVISDLAKRWLAGEIDSADYFAQCREIAEAEAKRFVAERLAEQNRNTGR